MKSFLKRYDILFVILMFLLSIPLAYYEVPAFFNVTDPTLLDLFKQLPEQIAQVDFKRADNIYP
jgi:hypothetical protein